MIANPREQADFANKISEEQMNIDATMQKEELGIRKVEAKAKLKAASRPAPKRK
jgi:hypothetical protein